MPDENEYRGWRSEIGWDRSIAAQIPGWRFYLALGIFVGFVAGFLLGLWLGVTS